MSEAAALSIMAEDAPSVEVAEPGASEAREAAPETADAAPKIPEGYVRVPGEDAKPEDLAAFHKALGVPEDPAGYGFDQVKLPEGVELDAQRVAALAPVMQKMGITPKAAKALAEADAAYAATQAEALAEQYAKEINDGRTALDKKWEANKRAVADMERGAVSAWKAFGDKDYAELMKTHQMDRHPAIVAFAANAGAAFGEALKVMTEGGVEPGKVQQFAKKYGFSTPEAPFVPGESDIPAQRRPGVLQYREE